ncbi:MAG: M3 family metallopeptidase [Promethearchaeota archaeon]
MNSEKSKEIAWDLSGLFSDVHAKEIDESIAKLKENVKSFAQKYKGNMITPTFNAQSIKELLETFETFYSDYQDIIKFGQLSFVAQMTDKDNKAINNRAQELQTFIGSQIAFIDLELGKFLHENPSIIDDPVLKNYYHHLERLQKAYPHTLSEIEEQIILEKDQFGINAWSELQSTWLNTRKFDVIVEGEKKTLSYGEANGLLTHPDRATRESANKSIYSLLGQDNEIFSTALRNIGHEWMKTSARRIFPTPLHNSLLAADVDEPVIRNLMKTIENNVETYRKYLRVKTKLMKLPKLGCHDIVAPLPDIPHKEYDWDTSKAYILEAYGNFDGEIQGFVKDMYESNHIDAAPRFGKTNGAFCSDWFKGKSAFILQTHNNDLVSMYTLAHELGHAVHAYYVTREQTILNGEISMCVAETASIFGELLLTDLLLEKASSDEEKIAILTHILDEAGMAAFQVSARFWFETKLYELIDQGKYLDGDTIAKAWTTSRDKIYGEDVEWFDEMNWEWCMKPHYFIPNFRYYNYPYVYAQLFVYALYRKYKQSPSEFVPKFKKLLKSGSSLSGKDLGAIMDCDVSNPDFWKLGIEQYGEFAKRIEDLVK